MLVSSTPYLLFNPLYKSSVGGGGGYTTAGVHFDNATSTHKGSTMVGLTNSKVGTVSFWFQTAGGDGVLQIIWLLNFGSGGTFQIVRNASNSIDVSGTNSASTSILFQRSTSTFVAANGWKHVLASWNLVTPIFQMYITDVNDSPTSTALTNDTLDYVGSGGRDNFFTDASGVANFNIADFWFDPTTFNDLSVTAFRRKFISAGLAPVDLGVTGQLPTGSQPIAFFKGPTTSFLTNLGSGGNFTTFAGALTAAATNPP